MCKRFLRGKSCEEKKRRGHKEAGKVSGQRGGSETWEGHGGRKTREEEPLIIAEF